MNLQRQLVPLLWQEEVRFAIPTIHPLGGWGRSAERRFRFKYRAADRFASPLWICAGDHIEDHISIG